jgi:hypothetical protein
MTETLTYTGTSDTREGPREAAHCDAALRANPPSDT